MKYISKPTVIDAVQYTGSNGEEVEKFVGTDEIFVYEQDVLFSANAKIYDRLHHSWITVYPSNWVIRGTKNEYYPCEDGVFKQKYEPYEES